MGTGPLAAAIAQGAVTSDRAAAIVEASPDGVLMLDYEAIIIEANLAAERLLGRPRDELVGMSMMEFVDPRTGVLEATRGFKTDTRGSGVAHLGVVRYRRHDGRVLQFDTTVIRTDDIGDTREFAILLNDVTSIEEEKARHQAAADRYQAVVEHSQHAFVLSADRIEDSLLISGESCLGYPAMTPLTGGVLSLVHPDDVDDADNFIESIRTAGPHHTSARELRLRSAHGRWLTCNIVAENLSHDPAVRGVVLRVADITRQRVHELQVESHIQRLQILIDNLGSAVMLEDADRRVLVANEAFVSMFDIPMSAHELMGADCHAAAEAAKVHFADPGGFLSGVAKRIADPIPVLGERLALVNGDVLERDYLPITADGDLTGHMWAYRNVTRQIQETRVLEEQNRSLAQLARLKNEFVARVSHELRSPLTSVVSFAELLDQSTQGSLRDDEREYLEVITRNGQRLLRLIEDLLLVAKLESHTLPLSLEVVDLEATVCQVATELSPSAQEQGVSLEVTGVSGPAMLADSLRIQQVATNLIGNAVRYTPPGGSVSIHTRPEQDRGCWTISVRDSGVGIPEEDLPQVFEPFFRAGDGASQPNGTGLGLSIVRLIVEEHGGEIDLTSQVGAGTEVTVRLPFEAA